MGQSRKKPAMLVDVLVCAVALLVTCLLPYATYTFEKVRHSLSGLDFMMGQTILGGKTVLDSNLFLWVGMVAAAVMLLSAILYSPKRQKSCAIVIVVMSIVSVIGSVQALSGVSTTLAKAKNVSVGYGNIIAVALGVVTLCRGMYLLRSQNVLSSLDFMIIPGMLYFLINNYIPMIGIAIAFKKIDYSVGIWKSPWVGLKNFQMLFASGGSFFDSDAWMITRNTLLYNLTFIILGTIVGITIGICLADLAKKWQQKFFQTSILLPQLISMVIVSYIVYALLSNETGMINKMLGDNAVNFYSQKSYWPFILVFVNIWKGMGYNAIIFLSSIVGIDKSIFEAARVDGATRWQTICRVTLPMLKPTIVTLTLLSVGRIFYSDFGLFYQVPMNSGALYSVTSTIDTYVYRSLMVLNNISVASAASVYQAVIGFVIVLSVNLLVRKLDRENAMF